MLIMPKKKKIFPVLVLFLFLFSFNLNANAQTLPAFEMRLSTGKIFSSTNVSPERPTILIYFAPDCEHCQVLMKQIFSQINTFKKTQMILVTFEPVQVLPAFEKQFHTEKYPNIKVGSEVKPLFLQKYYQLQHTPFTVLFDKNNKLIISYKDFTPVNDLIKKLKALEKR